MKIDTMINITVSNLSGYAAVNDSKTIKSFVSSESKIEDLVISQLQRFLKSKGIEDMTLRLEAYPTSYSSLEYSTQHNGFNYEVFIRVETEKEKISFPEYYAPSTLINRQDEIREVLLNDTIEKIKQDLKIEDESFLAAIIMGVGFTQLSNLGDDELEAEYEAVLDEQELVS